MYFYTTLLQSKNTFCKHIILFSRKTKIKHFKAFSCLPHHHQNYISFKQYIKQAVAFVIEKAAEKALSSMQYFCVAGSKMWMMLLLLFFCCWWMHLSVCVRGLVWCDVMLRMMMIWWWYCGLSLHIHPCTIYNPFWLKQKGKNEYNPFASRLPRSFPLWVFT